MQRKITITTKIELDLSIEKDSLKYIHGHIYTAQYNGSVRIFPHRIRIH